MDVSSVLGGPMELIVQLGQSPNTKIPVWKKTFSDDAKQNWRSNFEAEIKIQLLIFNANKSFYFLGYNKDGL